MRILDLLRMSSSSLWKRKFRTVLTVLGVVIGTASIVVMISLGLGLNRATMEQIEQSGGLTTIQVMEGYGGSSGGAVSVMGYGTSSDEQVNRLDDAIVESFKMLEHVDSVVPILQVSALGKYGPYEAYLNIQGMPSEALAQLNIQVGEGHLPTDSGELEFFYGNQVAADFYKVPVASAFLIASVYALAVTKAGSVEERVKIFSAGAGHGNIMLMIWIFVLAGAFAGTAQDMGAIESTVNFTLRILPGNLLYAGLFLASCFISMSIGTSVGTIVALVPVASGIAAEAGMNMAFVTAIVAGGAFFGDNLSIISDTTIAATRTQDCSMSDKFKVNVRIVAPAAVIVAVLYVVFGLSVPVVPEVGEINVVKLLPYILVIGLAIAGMNVMSVLAIGIAVNAVIGFCYGDFDWVGWLASAGKGIAGMGELIIVTLLAGGMLEVIKHNGGLDFIISGLTKRISGKDSHHYHGKHCPGHFTEIRSGSEKVGQHSGYLFMRGAGHYSVRSANPYGIGPCRNIRCIAPALHVLSLYNGCLCDSVNPLPFSPQIFEMTEKKFDK